MLTAERIWHAWALRHQMLQKMAERLVWLSVLFFFSLFFLFSLSLSLFSTSACVKGMSLCFLVFLRDISEQTHEEFHLLARFAGVPEGPRSLTPGLENEIICQSLSDVTNRDKLSQSVRSECRQAEVNFYSNHYRTDNTVCVSTVLAFELTWVPHRCNC